MVIAYHGTLAPMPLPRLQLFEWNDLARTPAPLRDGIVETLSRTLRWGRMMAGLVEPVRGFLAAAGTDEVLDLCAGAGGPAGVLAEELGRVGAAPRFVLTDLFPRTADWAELARAHPGVIDYVPDKQIWVQGHTDATPIRPSAGAPPRFASNWELSSARALTVVHYLQDEAKVDPRRLAAVAFGEHRPAARAKAKNRRIEIVLYPNHQLAR